MGKPKEDDDDDFEVETAEGQTLDEQVQQKVERKADAPEAGVEELKRQLAEANARRDVEVSARRNAEAQAQQAAGNVHNTRLQALQAYEINAKQGADAATAALAAAKAKYRNAMESADFDAAADAQAEIAQAVASKNSADYQLQQVEGAKKQIESQAAQVETRTNDTPVVQGRSAQWIAAHPEFNTNESYKNKAMGAHYQILAEGVAVESDEYFRKLDAAMSPREEIEITRTAPKPTSSMAAPPSRSSAPVRSDSPQRVRLTPAQLEAAEMSGMSAKDYAKHLVALQNSGKMAR